MHGRRKRNRRDASPITDFLPGYKIHLTSRESCSLSRSWNDRKKKISLCSSSFSNRNEYSRISTRFHARVVSPLYSVLRCLRVGRLRTPRVDCCVTRLVFRSSGDRDIYTGAVVKKEYLLLLFGWEFELMVGDISSVLFWNYRGPFEGITISGGGTNGGARCFLGRAINPSGELAKYFGLDRYTPRYLGRRISANEASGNGEGERWYWLRRNLKVESEIKREKMGKRISSTTTVFVSIYFGERESSTFFFFFSLFLARQIYILLQIYSSWYLRYCEFDASNIIRREK